MYTLHMSSEQASTTIDTRYKGQQIINQVMDMLASGHTTGQIVDFCADNWQIKRRQSMTYLKRARQELIDAVTIDHREKVAQTARYYDKVKHVAETKGHWRLALDAERAKAKLLGLNSPERLPLANDDQNTITLTIRKDS